MIVTIQRYADGTTADESGWNRDTGIAGDRRDGETAAKLVISEDQIGQPRARGAYFAAGRNLCASVFSSVRGRYVMPLRVAHRFT